MQHIYLTVFDYWEANVDILSHNIIRPLNAFLSIIAIGDGPGIDIVVIIRTTTLKNLKNSDY